MSPSERHWTPSAVLNEASTALVNAEAVDWEPALLAVIDQVSQLLGATSSGIWRLDKGTQVATRTLHWSVEGAGDDLSTASIIGTRLETAISSESGHAILPLASVIDVDSYQAVLGPLRDQMTSIGLVEDLGSERTSLNFSGLGPHLSEAQEELARGLTPIVRQFYRRVRAEMALQTKIDLDQLVLRLGALFRSADASTLDDVIAEAFSQLRSVLRCDAAVIIDLTSDTEYQITSLSVGENVTDVPLPPDAVLSGTHALAGRQHIHRFVASQRVGTLSEMPPGPMTQELADAVGGADDRRFALVQLPGGTTRDALLGVIGTPGRDWSHDDLGTLRSVASILRQARERVAAQALLEFRLEGQQLLTEIGQRFVTTRPDQVEAEVDRAVQEVGAFLGTYSPALFTIGEKDIVMRRIVEGSATQVVRFGRDDFPSLTSLLLGDAQAVTFDLPSDMASAFSQRPAGERFVFLSPVTDATSDRTMLGYSRRSEIVPSDEYALEVVKRLAQLIGQLWSRIALQRLEAGVLATAVVLAEIAAALISATDTSFDQVLSAACAVVGPTLGFHGIKFVAHSDAASEPNVLAAWSLAHGADVADPGIDPVAGEDPHRLHYDIQTSDLSRLSMHIVTPGVPDSQSTAHVATFLNLVGQTHARIIAERELRRRHALQSILTECAAILAEATSDTLPDCVSDALSVAGSALQAARCTIWACDWDAQVYRRVHAWRQPGSPLEGRQTITWGHGEVLDEIRLDGSTFIGPISHPTRPGHTAIAFPLAHAGRLEALVTAVSGHGVVWLEDVREVLETLSHIIREVETRVNAGRYADAAFSRSPIGMALRDSELRLITCNEAFATLTGMTAADLVGTRPHDVFSHDGRPVAHPAASALSGEVLMIGPARAGVWAQLTRSQAHIDDGEQLWLDSVENITDRREAQDLLRFQATHDDLTGLSNRRHLATVIEQISAEVGTLAVMILDLDRFKNINDSLGHDRGDLLLVTLSERIQGLMQEGQIVARLGGDEFAIVMPGPVVAAEAEALAGRVLQLIGEPVQLGQHSVYPSASIGIAIVDRRATVADALRRADTALYRAKEQGRGSYSTFDGTMQRQAVDRMATESGLRHGLLHEEFRVHYQPLVALPDGHHVGAEALVRWDHPTRGLLAPGAFIEIAESTGLVVGIGEIVLAQACAEAAQWPGGDDGPRIAVNLAASQLQRDETIDTVRAVLEHTGLAPHRLCLEITESAVMADMARSERNLGRLKDLGVRLALDDFGTGFSSLAYLKRFPVDVLKIDREFVAELAADTDNVSFIRSIISLASALNLGVVAEGVETQEGADALFELGCLQAQGFFFARPEPAEKLLWLPE